MLKYKKIMNKIIKLIKKIIKKFKIIIMNKQIKKIAI